MIFTTSWDDGYALDTKLGTLLSSRGLTGTFYVCPVRQHRHTMLSKEEIVQLSKEHEVGAHSMTHPKLTQISPALMKQEIYESKEWVENITQKTCTMFCYPYGDTNKQVRESVQQAGFAGARTTEDLRFDAGDAYAMPVTLQVMPFPKRLSWSRWWHPLDPYGPLRARIRKLIALGIPPRSMTKDWLMLATELFDNALASNAPIFHLWGHSSEVEKYNKWSELEIFLDHVKKHGNRIQALPNSAVTEAVTRTVHAMPRQTLQ